MYNFFMFSNFGDQSLQRRGRYYAPHLFPKLHNKDNKNNRNKDIKYNNKCIKIKYKIM